MANEDQSLDDWFAKADDILEHWHHSPDAMHSHFTPAHPYAHPHPYAIEFDFQLSEVESALLQTILGYLYDPHQD